MILHIYITIMRGIAKITDCYYSCLILKYKLYREIIALATLLEIFYNTSPSSKGLTFTHVKNILNNLSTNLAHCVTYPIKFGHYCIT